MGFSSREKKDLVAIHGSEAVAVVVVNLRPTTLIRMGKNNDLCYVKLKGTAIYDVRQFFTHLYLS